MRTTLTLDDDVAASIERLRTSRRQPLRTVVNDMLRRGLLHADAVREPRAAYHTRAADMGRCQLASLDDVAEALTAAEGEAHP